MRSLSGVIVSVTLILAVADPWNPQESGSKARFRGVSAVSRDVAWASGSQGTCVRTIDGGASWQKVAPLDSSMLDFRDVHGFDDRSACLLSIGPGELSRVYRTTDGGSTWTLQHTNQGPKGFLDAIAFWDDSHGLALGDPVDGRFVILQTSDGGRTWAKIPIEGMPEAIAGEGAFAASGTCLMVQGGSNAWFGTGGGVLARVFRTTDRGKTWEVANTSIRANIPSAGIFSIAFRDATHGIAVGGDYKSVDNPDGNIAVTEDGGKTWTSTSLSRPAGFRSAVAFIPGREQPTVLAVGPSGADLSTDAGRTWSKLGTIGFHALGVGNSAEAVWAVGEDGRIAKFNATDIAK